MVLVVGDSGQAGVEGHHDERELGQGAQQARSVPGEPGLQVKLGGAKRWDLMERRKGRKGRVEEDTHHQVEHGVHGEGGVAGEEGLPEEDKHVHARVPSGHGVTWDTHLASWTLLSGPWQW